MSNDLAIGIIVGSTRPQCNARLIAEWVNGLAVARRSARYEIVDIADFKLPLLDEPAPPMFGKYSQAHTKAWANAIGAFDGYVFVTPEYNHSTSGALKNAIDFLFAEWNNKAAGFVSYGGASGTRAVEHLRQIVGELMIADVRTAVGLSLFDDFENFSVFKPRELHKQTVGTMLDQVERWAAALRTVR